MGDFIGQLLYWQAVVLWIFAPLWATSRIVVWFTWQLIRYYKLQTDFFRFLRARYSRAKRGW